MRASDRVSTLLRNRRAFTLVELMIVIAIIAILAAILVTNFLHARSESQTSACEDNEKAIATALEEYAVDHNGTYPATLGGLASPYLLALPSDPVDSSAYGYTAALGSYGSYAIFDSGKHDKTTVTLDTAAGAGCAGACTMIEYFQAGGLVGQ